MAPPYLKLQQVVVGVRQQVDGLLLHLHLLLSLGVARLSLLQLVQHLHHNTTL